jgi:hypothetical protein
VAGILDAAPKLKAWADRIAALGHYKSSELSSEEAVSIARKSTPASTEGVPFIDTYGIALGERVTVTPTDYGFDPVAGELVLASANELAVRRTDERAGTVVVHFPRLGFLLKKI